MLALGLIVAAAEPGNLAATVRHLNQLASQDLPTSLEFHPPSPSHIVGEAKALTTRFPKAASAWVVRGKCEMRAADFKGAEASFRRAAILGEGQGPRLARRAVRYASVGRRVRGWGTLNQLMDRGNGSWIAACTTSLQGPRTLVEIGPSGMPRVLAKFALNDAYFTDFTFGFRDLDGDRRPELIAQSYTWLSNGGNCELVVCKGSRGRWRRVYRKDSALGDVPMLDLNRDGIYELAVRDWVWYKGPTWTRIFRFEGGRLRETTRQHRRFLRRQVDELRYDLRQWDTLPDRREERREGVEAILREYGYRL